MTEPAPRTPAIGATVRGGARSAIAAHTLVQVGSVAATVILARLLTPVEFGIVALAQSVMGVTTLIGLRGITTAIVTTRGDVHAKAVAYFWLTLGVGTALAALLATGAPAIVNQLGQPDVANYVRLLALTLPFSLMTLVPQALQQRRLQFGRMNLVTVIGAAVYFILEIVLAVLGWGAWAVIIGQVCGSITSFLSAFLLAKWIPLGRPSFRDVREDISLVSNMGASSFLTYLGKNADYWAVSGVMGAAALGIYYIAYVVPNIVRLRLSDVFRQVMLPVLARMPTKPERIASWVRAANATLALALPALVGIAAVTEPLIRVFFGSQWMEAVNPMRLITMAGIVDIAFYAVSTMALAQRQRVGRTTMLLAFRAVLIGGGALTFALLHQDLTSVAVAVLGASILTLLVQEIVVARPLGIGLAALGTQPVRLAVLCGTMYATVQVGLGMLPAGLHPVAQLMVGVAVGMLTYVGIGMLVARAAVEDLLRQTVGIVRGR